MKLRASLRRLAPWAWLGLTVSAAAQITTTQNAPNVTLVAGTAASAVTPVTASGGTGSFTFAVSPALPSGLALNATTGALGGTPALSNLTPPFAGYDDFNAGSEAKWAYFFRLDGAANGALNFASARLEFTKGAGAGNYFLGWDGDGAGTASRTVASYHTSWVAQLTVTNTFVAGVNEFAGFGFEATTGAGSYAAVMLTNGGGTLRLRAEQGGALVGSEVSVGTATTVRLRLAWDAGAKALSCYYSLDGGATFPLLAVFNSVAGWSSLDTSGFLLELFGNSNAAAAIPAGAIYADNFRVNTSSPTTHTVTVTDGAGATASNTFGLVLTPPALSANQAVPARTLFTGSAATAFTPVTAAGGIAPVKFTVVPALAPGLSLDGATGALSGTLTDAALIPAFVGSDDFNTGSDAKWAYYFRTLGRTAGNGLLAFSATNGRLDFTKAAGEGSYFIGWDGDPATPASRTSASLATDWVADLDVTNTFLTPAGEHAGVGLEAAAAGQFAAIVLVNAGGSLNVTANGTGIALHSVPVATSTSVRLRLAWNAATGELTTSFSEDGGATYQTLHVHHPLTEWAAGSAAGGFFFEAFADSNAAAAITEGAIYADNFNVVHASTPTTIHSVMITDALGTTATNTFRLSVSVPPPAPVIAGMSPTDPRPGDTVLISGSNLAGASAVAFGGVNATFTYNAGTDTLSATVPGSARSGVVTVTSDGGVSEGFAYTVPLTITSQPQHSVVTPGQATSLGVIAAGGAPGSYTYQWRRNGIVLAGATNQILYVGGMSPAEVGDYDVVVGVGSETLASGPAALRLASSNRWQWRNRLPTANDLSTVAYGNGRYVAVGWSGTILSSTNGSTWEPQPQRPPAALLNVAYANGQFVIVGTNGNVLTSADGLAWTQGNVAAPVTLWGLVYGHGKWVATGSPGAIFTSVDGTAWTRQAAPVGSSINGVAVTSTGFVAVSSSGHILTTNTDAATWTASQPAPLANVNLFDVKVRNGVYVASGARKVFSSTDGTTWTTVTLPTTDAGIDWNEIVANTDGFTVVGGSYPNTSSDPHAYAIFSADGGTWVSRALPGSPAFIGATSGGAGYVAVGALGQISHSADGVTWTAVTTGPALPGDMYGGASGPGGTIFVGFGGRILRSANHVDGWSLASPATTQHLMAATYAAGKYVVVGGNGALAASPGSGVILHSATGDSFTALPSLAAPLNAVAYDPYVAKFVAAGEGDSIYVAADPTAPWTAVAKPAGTGAIRAAVADGGMYALVGDNGTVLISYDAVTWMRMPSATDVALTAVAFGDGRIVAGGFNSSPAAARSVFVTSIDGGYSWQQVSVPFTGSIRSLSYADGRFRAVGGTSSVLTSVDGLNWTADTSQFAGLLRAIVRTPVGYAVGGTGGAVATLAAPSVQVQSQQQNVLAGADTAFTPVIATGGTPPYTFTISPALPPGLSFSPAGAVSGAAADAAAVSPFAGADDFNAGSSSKWPYYFRTSGESAMNGMLAFANSRLEFSKAATPGSYFRMWDGDPASSAVHTSASLVTSWVADVTVTNTYVATTNEFASIGFEVSTAPGRYVALMLTNAGGTPRIRAESSPTSATEATVTATTDVKLRLTWDATTQVLTASYQLPAASGYTTLATFNLATLWPAGTADHGFSFDVFGNSNAAGAIAAGPLLADNFAVTATSPATTLYAVTATDSAGVSASGSFKLVVAPATPVIASVTPESAPAGATVTINGSSLGSATAVRFNGVDATFSIVSSSQIVATVPATATSGPLTVVFGSGTTLTPVPAFTAIAPPVITVPPAATTAIAGTPAELRVTATSAAAVTYQWYRDTTALAGASAATLTFANPQVADEGLYHVVVSNSAGSVTSPDAALTVNVPAAITVQPQSRAVLAGTSTTLSVSATGKPAPTYQWLKDGTPLSGQTSATLSFASVTAANAGSYTVVVSNGVGAAVTSSPAVLTLNAVAAIANQPTASASYLAGASLTLSVGATGSPAPTYQWRKGGAPISGATASSLVFSALTLADAGTYDVVVTNVIDGLTNTATSNPVTFTVQQGPVITRGPAAQTIVAGGTATFSVEATASPAATYVWQRNGVTVGTNSSTLTLSGVPYGSGGTITVTVSNSVGSVTSAPVTLTVNPVAPVITSATTATAIRGRSFTYQATAATQQATYAASGLPSGLTLNSATGSITGTPTVDGTFNVVLTASNVTGSDTRTLVLTVNPPPPIINSAASATGRVNTAFTYGIQAVNTPTSYGASGLPPGLSVNPGTGVISGTPTQAGVFNITLSATNAGGTTTSLFVLTIDPPLNAPVYSGALQLSGVQGAAFSFTPSFSNAPTSYAAAGLPAGLSINATTGVITGTVSETGTWTVQVSATNVGGTTTVSLSLTINPAPTAPVITSASMATATAGSAFSFTLTASGSPTSFSATGLPSTLSLNAATGVISGTPTAPGTFNVQVRAANSVGTGPQGVLVLTINPAANAPIITSSPVVPGRVGDALSYALTATNAPTSFAVTSGTLPAGLAFNAATGAITGTPTQVGQFRVWFAAANASQGLSLEVLFSISAADTTPVVTSNGTAAGQVGQPFSYLITATNSPTSFAIASGTLPGGLSLAASTGAITGIPAEATTAPVTVTLNATNAAGATSSPKSLTITIAPAPATPIITSALTASGRVGQTFSYQVTASENATSYLAQNLPAGLSLNATTGALSGTPTQAGTFNVTLRAANAAGLGAPSTLVVTVAPAPLAPAITSPAAASGKVGATTAFSYAITATPAPILSYGLTGTLPLGLVFNTSTGVISGQPAQSGLFTVEITATGEGGTSLPQTLVLNIAPADNVPVITSPLYAVATVGQSFTYQITAASTPAFPAAPFPAPYTLDAVNLPAGLAVSPATGLIQGVPSTAGMFTATLVGTNAAGTGPLRDLVILVQPAATAPVVTSLPSASAQVGLPFAYQITATNSPLAYEVLGAPAWMTVNSQTGALAGTPSAPGTFTVQLIAGNAAGASNPLTLALTVAPAPNTPVVISSRTASGLVGSAFSYQIAATNSPTAFVATGLPAGLSLNGATGVIAGTPSVSGQFEITLLASNANGSSQPVTLILGIQPNVTFVLPGN